MEKIILIPELTVELHFRGKKIKCYDQITKQILDSKELRHNIKKIKQVSYNKFKLIDTRFTTFTLHIKLIKEVRYLKTNAQYILDLNLDTPNHGYYFGTYEIGEFSIEEDLNLKMERSHALEYCHRGQVTLEKNIIFLALRESETSQGPHSYFLVKLQWQKNLDPKILSKTPMSSPILAMLLTDNHLLLGLKNGNIQQWDPKNSEYLETIARFQAPVSVITKGKGKILAASHSGEITAMSMEGSIRWKTKPSEKPIHGLIEDSKGIHLIDQTSMYFLVDPETGIIQRKENWKLNPSMYSNIAILRGWFVFNDGQAVTAVHRGYKKKISHPLQDPYVRQFVSHPQGILTGDDDGIIRMWALGKLEIW